MVDVEIELLRLLQEEKALLREVEELREKINPLKKEFKESGKDSIYPTIIKELLKDEVL